MRNKIDYFRDHLAEGILWKSFDMKENKSSNSYFLTLLFKWDGVQSCSRAVRRREKQRSSSGSTWRNNDPPEFVSPWAPAWWNEPSAVPGGLELARRGHSKNG